jgi:hypothetical protein
VQLLDHGSRAFDVEGKEPIAFRVDEGLEEKRQRQRNGRRRNALVQNDESTEAKSVLPVVLPVTA